LKREHEEEYIWALKVFSKVLDEKQSCVIITEREFALINTIKIIFLNCTHLLCVWNIEKNILTNYKIYFELEDNWIAFLSFWTKIAYFSTELEYNELWKEFKLKYVEKK
jgi:MULE transposase domain